MPIKPFWDVSAVAQLIHFNFQTVLENLKTKYFLMAPDPYISLLQKNFPSRFNFLYFNNRLKCRKNVVGKPELHCRCFYSSRVGSSLFLFGSSLFLLFWSSCIEIQLPHTERAPSSTPSYRSCKWSKKNTGEPTCNMSTVINISTRWAKHFLQLLLKLLPGQLSGATSHVCKQYWQAW